MPKGIFLRPYPYPWKAAFSFSNDIDTTTPARYSFIRDFFRSIPAAAPGAEMGLPYCESFFVFNRNPYHPDQVALKTHPDLLMPDLESGYLGVLHTWGDYNFNPVFTRQDAAKAYSLLSECRNKPRVWINHGTLHNLQNVGAGVGYGDWQEYIDGASNYYRLPEYHLDYALKLGIDFFWIERPTRVIGQNVKLDAKSCWQAYYSQNKSQSRALKRAVDYLFNRFVRSSVKALREYNRLLKVRQLRDGSKIYEFIRYGNYSKASADDLGEIISPQVLDQLVERRGTMVLMTHLGKTSTSPDEFTESSMEALKHLKLLYDIGNVWVCRLDRLLEYQALIESIRFNSAGNEIIINGFTSEVWGDFCPEPEKLEGITFCCPKPDNVAVKYGNYRMEFKPNPKDADSCRSVTLTGRIARSD
ncbi:MAG: hypothetical protein JXQ83_00180 [Candidatus Glassbacteria bacterium]|nr:hypothetical protein [Candidatus Glassbacteria bacterium]